MGFKKLAPLEFEVLLPYRTVTVQYPYRTVSNRILPYPRIWLDTVRVRVRVRYGYGKGTERCGHARVQESKELLYCIFDLVR